VVHLYRSGRGLFPLAGDEHQEHERLLSSGASGSGNEAAFGVGIGRKFVLPVTVAPAMLLATGGTPVHFSALLYPLLDVANDISMAVVVDVRQDA
jgi:hypothetical protein